jgi:hypothetical protein
VVSTGAKERVFTLQFRTLIEDHEALFPHSLDR